MKNIILTAVVTVVVVVGLMAGLNVYQASAAQQDTIFYGMGGPGGNGMNQACAGDITNIPASDLTEAEEATLIYMVQEEQLARDVYTVLNEKWAGNIFQNIMQSEQMHMDAVKQLLTRYEIADPGLEAGQYADPALQALYDDLVAQGNQSLVEALKVGALIEETDIKDLQDRLAKTDNADIQQVFNNLLHASSNHLRAFANNYATTSGEVYQPVVLSAEEYQAILNSPMGRGMGGMMNSGTANNNNFGGRMGGRMGGRR